MIYTPPPGGGGGGSPTAPALFFTDSSVVNVSPAFYKIPVPALTYARVHLVVMRAISNNNVSLDFKAASGGTGVGNVGTVSLNTVLTKTVFLDLAYPETNDVSGSGYMCLDDNSAAAVIVRGPGAAGGGVLDEIWLQLQGGTSQLSIDRVYAWGWPR